MGDETLLHEAKAQTYVRGADSAFMAAVDPEFRGMDERRDPDGSAPLFGQGPTKLAKYWPEAKDHIISSLPQPLAGEESTLAVIGGDMLCLGPSNTPVQNIAMMLGDTHTLLPDHFVACRHGQLEDIRDLLKQVMACYKRTMCVSGPDGSPGTIQKIEMYPGTMVIVLGGHDFICPTIAGDSNEAKPISKEKVEVVREIAKTLTRCRKPCVILPPPARKFGVGPIFDDNTIQIAKILDDHGIIYYRPAMWMQLEMYDTYYPLDTLENRRVYMRLFQCLMRVTEWYGMIRDKYCDNEGMVQTDELGLIPRFCPHDCDPAELVASTIQRTEEETER
jgi:hypothetical protein